MEVATPSPLCISQRLRPEHKSSLFETVLILLFGLEVFLPKESTGDVSKLVLTVLETTTWYKLCLISQLGVILCIFCRSFGSSQFIATHSPFKSQFCITRFSCYGPFLRLFHASFDSAGVDPPPFLGPDRSLGCQQYLKRTFPLWS